MTEIANRAQRRQRVRRAIKHGEEGRQERTDSKKKAKRIDHQRNAQDINRSKALRAAGLEPEDRSFWVTVQQFAAPKDNNQLCKTVTLLALLGVVVYWLKYHLTQPKSNHLGRIHTWDSHLATIDGTKEMSLQMPMGLMPLLTESF